MLKIPRLFVKNRISKAQGFTMLEVLAGIMMTAAFVAASLQLITVNAMFKVKAEREAQALFWIQENKEEIRATASSIPYLEANCPNGSGDSYAEVLWEQLEGDVTTAKWYSQTQRKILGKDYQLQRRYSIDNNNSNVLKIEFVVVDTETEKPIIGKDVNQALSIDEVIPEAAYACP